MANRSAMLRRGSEAALATRSMRRIKQVTVPISDSPSLVAVWSPAGSSGKSTIAASLAAVMADGQAGAATRPLLIDLDTFAPSQAILHGLTEITAGVLGSARLIRQERYTDAEHERLTVGRKGYSVLTGITSLERWAELDAHSLQLLLHELTRRHASVIVDVAGNPASEAIEPGTGLKRSQAAISTLSKADEVIVVTAADQVSLARLVAELPAVRAIAPGRILVAVNRSRSGAIGQGAIEQITELLLATDPNLLNEDIVFVPDDAKSCDEALLRGEVVCVLKPRSAMARAVRVLASQINSSHVHSARARETERQG